MSNEGYSYTEQIKQFGETLSRFDNKLNNLDLSVREILTAIKGNDMGDDGFIKKLKENQDKLDAAVKDVKALEDKYSNAKYALIGWAAGAGIGGSAIFNIIKNAL
jgi:hypothetical protein